MAVMNVFDQSYTPSASLDLGDGASQLSPLSSSNRLKLDNTSKKNKQTLLLSTSFVSTRRIDNTSPTSTSPLQARRSVNNATKMLINAKSEINRLQQELNEVRKKKENTKKIREATGTNIYSGTYSTEHLQKYSMRIRTNTQIREFDKTIKKLEKEIQNLTNQYERAKDLPSLDKPCYSSESVSVESLKDLSNDQGTISVDHTNTSKIYHTDISTDPTGGINSSISTIDTVDQSRSHTPVTGTMESATWKISECMQTLHESNISSDFVLQQSNKLVDLLRKYPELRQDLVLKSFLNTIQELLLRDDKVISSSVYRMCRYLIDGEQFIHTLIKLRIDAFLIMSLAKGNNNIIEREQAIKLIRLFAEYRIGITKGIVQGIISCIEKTDDTIRNIALETLLELCFEHPQLVNECNGMRVLEGFLHDYSSFPLASIILDTVLELMATHSTRTYFLNDFNISVLATAFSDFNGKGSINTEKLQNSGVLISRALKNDNGLMLFSVDNFKPIKELLAFIKVPLYADYLIDIFLNVLHIKPYPKPKDKNLLLKTEPSNFLHESSSFNQHLALIVSILDYCKFDHILSELIGTGRANNLKERLINKSRYLLAEYMNFKNNVIRDGKYSSFESYSKDKSTVFEEYFKFDMVVQDMNRSRNTLGLSKTNYSDNLRKYSKNVKDSTMMGDMDDLRFRKMVYDSKVLQTKDFTQWNWNIIQELLEGPLLNKKHFEELVKSTKFIRRLLVFYRPLRLRFSNVDQGARLSQKYIQVGCSFFKMLTTNPEGMKILTDDTKIIPQLASLIFNAIEESSRSNIFNEDSLKTKIIPGYFKFIGILTQSSNGVSILMRWNFFTVIYKMFQFDSRIGLKFLLLTLPELDLSHSSHCRNILGRALVVSNEYVRMSATKFLGERLKQSLHQKEGNASCLRLTTEQMNMQRYMMEMLTRQLYDLSPNIVAIADQSLYEYIAEGEKSQEISTSLRTTLNQMVFINSPILFELLSRSYGFQLLNEIKFVEQQRLSWLDVKNKEYVDTVEKFMKKNLYSQKRAFNSRTSSTINRLPLHFYESLAKTEDGITLISQNGDLIKFMNVIKRYISEGMNNENPDDVLNLKAAIWCSGFIGSTKLGIGLLDNYSLVEDILQISYSASVTTVRFTAFYVLGLIGSTREGCEILDEMGWNCTVDVQERPVGITLPDRLDKFLSFNEKKWFVQSEYKVETTKFNQNSGEILGDIVPIQFNLDHLLYEKNMIENTIQEKNRNDDVSLLRTHTPPSVEASNSSTKVLTTRAERGSTLSNISFTDGDMTIIDKIIESISQLGNHILSNAAIKTITDLNNKYGPVLFESEVMFMKVMEMLEKFRFKPQVRKFLCELFINVRALENVIRNDKKIKKNTNKPEHKHSIESIVEPVEKESVSSRSIPSSPLS